MYYNDNYVKSCEKGAVHTIVTVTLNPAVDKVARLDAIREYEINRLSKVESDAGGKGINVSRTIKALHSVSIATGFLGGSGGNFIDCLLQREEIESHMIQIIGNTRNNLKIVDADNRMTEFNEEGPFILQSEQDELFDYLRGCLDGECILILSGSMPKGMSRSTYSRLIEMAKENGSVVILDTTYRHLADSIEAKPAIVKASPDELRQLYHIDHELSEAELIQCGKRMIEDYDLQMGITLVHQQCAYVFTASNVFKTEFPDVDVKTSVGAGDAFVAGFAVGMEQNADIHEVIQLASGCYTAAMLSKNAHPTDIHTIKEWAGRAEIIELK